MFDLTGKVAIVTGSDSGIGQAIAVELAKAGAGVAVTWHSDQQGAEDTARQVREAGRRALVQHLDVMDEGQVEALFDATEAELGVPDILVNNAGTGGDADIGSMSTETWDRVVRTDLYGPFYCCRAFIQRRKRAEAGGGKIVNVTSVHEAIPSPKNAAYGAAKGGLLTFTRSLALELAPQRINVNAVAPGFIVTDMTAATAARVGVDFAQFEKAAVAQIPVGRAGRPEDVANTVSFLVSEGAGFVSGQVIYVAGGPRA